MSKNFNKTLICGLGLIGGSFAKTLRKNGICEKIFAFDSDEETIELAKSENVIDNGISNLSLLENIGDFDFIVIAAPLFAYEEILEELALNISPSAVIIDLGSVKKIEEQLEILPKNLRKNFVPCHPIAGSEKTGFENSFADLFADKKFIICPEFSDKNSVKKVEDLIKKIGANFEHLSAKKHDEIYALMSHLPQFLSFLTKDFSPKKITDNFLEKAFRLDDSDPQIWEEIFALNEVNLEKFYLKFFDSLDDTLKRFAREPDFFKQFEDVKKEKFDEEYFEKNFATIFFRILIVKSYLEIPETKTYLNYAGSGFRDFTSIISILNYDSKKLAELIKKNQSKILKLFQQIS